MAEGCAHLTESLCGYGETGGNQLFFARYAQAPWKYSLGGSDADGAQDSAGKRGGSAALLFRLFESAGGAYFNGNTLIDRGGAAFLRSLLDPRDGGWVKLARACGRDPQMILGSWAEGIALCGDSFLREAQVDSTTGQRVDIGFFVGEVRSPKGGTTVIDGPKLIDFFAADSNLVPFSIAWGTRIELPSRGSIDVSCEKSDGRGNIILAMR
ncbi:MAG: hypothetical protein Q8M76_13595 [Spirochaetaceae bacterium]|nr:hypothetical protein [Spirochaetaceae bacterium]